MLISQHLDAPKCMSYLNFAAYFLMTASTSSIAL
jgi:hypothetical protein